MASRKKTKNRELWGKSESLLGMIQQRGKTDDVGREKKKLPEPSPEAERTEGLQCTGAGGRTTSEQGQSRAREEAREEADTGGRRGSGRTFKFSSDYLFPQ